MLGAIYDPTKLSMALLSLCENHDYTDLDYIKDELNKLFDKSNCKEVLYTENTDRLFFGIKVYPSYNGNSIAGFLGDEVENIPENYYVEFDSKLFNPLLCLDENELFALVSYEIYNVVYNGATRNAVRSAIDVYAAKIDDYIDPVQLTKSYRELLAYAIKDSISKVGSIFTKIGNEEVNYDLTEKELGLNTTGALMQAVNKLTNSEAYLNKAVDPILITLSWVLRFKNEFTIRRGSMFKTLMQATELSASQLEKRELVYASKVVSKMDDPITEGVIENIKNRFSKKFAEFKLKGIRAIKNDIYELNLRLRCASEMEDLMSIIRIANSDIAIIQDYLTEDIDDYERKSCEDALQELYDIRQKAAKEKQVRDKSDSLISVYYPNID